jgi:hypothetical protein
LETVIRDYISSTIEFSDGYRCVLNDTIHFAEFDTFARLPIGTTKRLLAIVAESFHYYPTLIGENLIRFEYRKDSYLSEFDDVDSSDDGIPF